MKEKKKNMIIPEMNKLHAKFILKWNFLWAYYNLLEKEMDNGNTNKLLLCHRDASLADLLIPNEASLCLFQIKFFLSSEDRSKYWRSRVLSGRNKIDDADIFVGLMRVRQQRAAGWSALSERTRSIFRQCGLPFIFILPNGRGNAASSWLLK